MTFGQMPPANGFLEKKDFKNEYFYEMEVGFSEEISLFQLNNFTPPKNIHTEKYPFYTSSSKFMENHFRDYSNWMFKNYLKNNSKLIEIGSNDGTLLKNFQKTDIDFLGFEPSSKIAELANQQKIKTINQFFDKESALELTKYKKNTDVICAANGIAHIPDL